MKILSCMLVFSLVVSYCWAGVVPQNSRVYVEPMNGFETYIMAALAVKKVPVIVTSELDKADFVIRGSSDSQKPGWARTIFTGQYRSDEQASISLVDRRTGTVVFAYAVNKIGSVHGKQSAAEACAKHLKSSINR